VLDEVEVNVASASPAANGSLAGEMFPFVAENCASGNGTVVMVSAPADVSVMSAVTVDEPPGVTDVGEAVTPRIIHGSKSAPVPTTAPQPVLPGPALQPHQFFSRSTVWLFALSIAVVVEMMRLKCATAVSGVAELFVSEMPEAKPVTVDVVMFA